MQEVFDYKATHYSDVLKSLIKYNTLCKEDTSEMVSVELLLKSGQNIQGIPVSLDEHKESQLVLSSEYTRDVNRPHYVTLVSMLQINALTINNAHNVKEILLGKSVSVPIAAGDVPTRLELKKKLARLEEELNLKFEVQDEFRGLIESEESEKGKYLLGLFLTSVHRTFLDLNKDELGQEVLTSIKSVSLDVSDQLLVEKTENTLKLFFSLNDVTDDYTIFLTSEIEKLF